MSIYGPAGIPPRTADDLSPIPDELKLFARIEGLIGEEAALLAIPRKERRREEHERLRAISAELDRIFKTLGERAHRLRRDGGAAHGESA